LTDLIDMTDRSISTIALECRPRHKNIHTILYFILYMVKGLID